MSITASADLLVYLNEFDVIADEPLACVVDTSFTATIATADSYVWDSALLPYENPSFPDDVLLDFTIEIRRALNAAVASPTWSVEFDSSNRLVISRSTTFTITWTGTAGARMMTWLGFSSNLSGGSSYTATRTPYWYMEASIAGRAEFTDVFEPDGTEIVQEEISDSGETRSVSSETADVKVNWVQNMESYADSFIRGAANSLDPVQLAYAPMCWQTLVEYIRGERLLFVYNSFLGPAWTVHKLQAKGASWKPDRVVPDDNTYWGIPLLTREVGTIAVSNPTVVVTGSVLIKGTLTATESGNVTSRKWQRSNLFGQTGTSGTWSDIASATLRTYSPVAADIGYGIRCVSTGVGGSGTSNVVRCTYATVPTTLEAWELRGLTPGAITNLVGGLASVTLTQASAGKRPVASATSFNGTPGLTFDGVDDCLAAVTSIFTSTQSLRIVVGLVDTTTASSILLELSVNATTQANAFAVAPNRSAAGRVSVMASSTAAANGEVYSTEALASACIMSFGVDAGATNGASFIRKDGADVVYVNVATGCTPAAAFANLALNLGSRNNGGSLPWAGTIGGVIWVLTGTAADDNLKTVEAYAKNGAGL